MIYDASYAAMTPKFDVVETSKKEKRKKKEKKQLTSELIQLKIMCLPVTPPHNQQHINNNNNNVAVVVVAVVASLPALALPCTKGEITIFKCIAIDIQ